MKLQELKENEPLKVVEVSLHLPKPDFNFKKNSNQETIEIKQIQTKIFTDGEIAKENEEVSESIEEYYIGKKKYEPCVDTLKTKNIFFKNHNYIITYLIVQEWKTIGNIRGWFGITKDISIYLKNPKDKEALKNAKQVIKEIQKHNSSSDYSSIFKMFCSQERKLEQFENEKISENVYSLKKINK